MLSSYCLNVMKYDINHLLSHAKITELGTYMLMSSYMICPNWLETAIDLFVKFYRTNFTLVTFIPKLHMLEDHIVPWMKRWRIGCGCMGEHGTESLHASLNQTENMKNMVDRLRVVLQNLHFKILPFTQSLEPPLLKKRKSKAGKEAL